MKKKKQQRLFILSLLITRKLTIITCVLAQTQRQEGDWESFIVEKGKTSGVPRFGGCWHEEAIDRLPRSRLSYMIG